MVIQPSSTQREQVKKSYLPISFLEGHSIICSQMLTEGLASNPSVSEC